MVLIDSLIYYLNLLTLILNQAETLGHKRKAGEGAEQPSVKKRVFTDKYEIYVDGSCLNNQDSDNRKAGWGAVIVKDDNIILELFGPVIIDPLDAYYIGAEKMSNNTAELSAIMEVDQSLTHIFPSLNY